MDVKYILRKFLVWLPIYNFEPIETTSDFERNKTELVFEVQRKRSLINKLNKKARCYFALTCLSISFTICNITINYFSDTETDVLTNYLEEFDNKLELIYSLNAVSELANNNDIMIPLLFIKDRDYEKAVLLLSRIDTPEAKWLLSLCYLKLENRIAAKESLINVVSSKGKYSLTAQEVLQTYY